MNDQLRLDTKRQWFLWGMILAWLPLIPAIIWLFNAFKGMSEQKATGLGAVAGGLAEGYATVGMILMLVMPVAAIVLLGKSLSLLNPMRALMSWVSICWSVLVLALSGLSVWLLFFQLSHAASVPH